MDCDKLDKLNRDLRNAKRKLKAVEHKDIKVTLNDWSWCTWDVESEPTRKIVRMMEKDRLEALCADLKRQIRELVNDTAEDADGKE